MARGRFTNGVPEMLVLTLLAEKEMYGYEIVRAIEERTSAEFSLPEGVVYPTLHALEASRHLRCRTLVRGGRERYYYRTTAKGRRRLGDIESEWRRLARIVALFLEGDKRDPAVP